MTDNKNTLKKMADENLRVKSVEDFEKIFFPRTVEERLQSNIEPYKVGEKIVKDATEKTKAMLLSVG